MSQRILIIEDEVELAALMQDYLRQSGFAVSHYADGAEGFAAVQAERPDLIVLDLMLPRMDGLVICREVRRFSGVPIIMVTARSEEIDRLLGLEVGADDYLCKPFSPRELVARVKAILRRSQADGTVQLLQLDETQQRVWVEGKAVTLTPSEFAILHLLWRQQGHVFSRARLLDATSPDNLDVTDRVVDSHIKNIRRKLNEVAQPVGYDKQEWIESVYGVGYRLADVGQYRKG